MKLQDYQEISNVSEAIKLAVQKYTDPEIETTEQDSAFVFLLSKANEGNTEAQDALEDECNLSLGDLVLDYSCQWAFDRMNTNGFDEYDEDLEGFLNFLLDAKVDTGNLIFDILEDYDQYEDEILNALSSDLDSELRRNILENSIEKISDFSWLQDAVENGNDWAIEYLVNHVDKVIKYKEDFKWLKKLVEHGASPKVKLAFSKISTRTGKSKKKLKSRPDPEAGCLYIFIALGLSLLAFIVIWIIWDFRAALAVLGIFIVIIGVIIGIAVGIVKLLQALHDSSRTTQSVFWGIIAFFLATAGYVYYLQNRNPERVMLDQCHDVKGFLTYAKYFSYYEHGDFYDEACDSVYARVERYSLQTLSQVRKKLQNKAYLSIYDSAVMASLEKRFDTVHGINSPEAYQEFLQTINEKCPFPISELRLKAEEAFDQVKWNQGDAKALHWLSSSSDCQKFLSFFPQSQYLNEVKDKMFDFEIDEAMCDREAGTLQEFSYDYWRDSENSSITISNKMSSVMTCFMVCREIKIKKIINPGQSTTVTTRNGRYKVVIKTNDNAKSTLMHFKGMNYRAIIADDIMVQ